MICQMVAPDRLHHRLNRAEEERVRDGHELDEHQPGGPEHDAQVAGQEHSPEQALDSPDRAVVAQAQVFRDGINPGAPQGGHEQEGGQHQGRQAADPVEVHDHDAVFVALARGRDVVQRADVGGHQAGPDGPPGQHLAGQEKVARALDVAGVVSAQDDHTDVVDRDDEQVYVAQRHPVPLRRKTIARADEKGKSKTARLDNPGLRHMMGAV